jgi:hypothetical protein
MPASAHYKPWTIRIYRSFEGQCLNGSWAIQEPLTSWKAHQPGLLSGGYPCDREVIRPKTRPSPNLQRHFKISYEYSVANRPINGNPTLDPYRHGRYRSYRPLIQARPCPARTQRCS